MIQEALARLLDGHDLSQEEARAGMTRSSWRWSPCPDRGVPGRAPAQGRDRGRDRRAASQAMPAHVSWVHPKRDDLVDTAGTGGDGANTWNISTAAGLVAAAAGAGVAKHGNRAASSATGAADVLEALGFELEQSPERLEESIDKSGIRRPLRSGASSGDEVCRAGAKGVSRPVPCSTSSGRSRTLPELRASRSSACTPPEIAFTLIAEALVRLDARRAFVVHGAGGIDELSPAGPKSRLRGRGRAGSLLPSSTRRTSASPSATRAVLRGADPLETNARELRNVLEGEVLRRRPIATRFS